MAHVVKTPKLTPADELRSLLEESEKLAVNMSGAGADKAVTLLENLDRIQALFPTLEAKGVDLKPEQARWEAVQGAVRRHSADIRRELKPLGGLAALRKQRAPAIENWWWRLDEIQRAQWRRRLARLLLATLALVIVVGGGLWLFDHFFPGDPQMREFQNYKLQAEQQLEAGDLAAAIASYEAARAIYPDDADALAWLVVLNEALERWPEADVARAELFEQTQGDVALGLLAEKYVILEQPEQALKLAQAAIEANPDNPRGYLALAGAYEQLDRLQEAIDALEIAAEKADEQNLPELQALTRMRLGFLLQRAAAERAIEQ
ncbi:MAG: tetratricopeptide repeat protein [Chloroflexi bacterium]|nr:tetratricopeptide repeat protein [Chloroflexota bacterium]